MLCFIWSNFLFKFFSLSAKSFFFTKLAISFLLAKFACANLEAKSSDVNVLNSYVVIYLLLWLWSVILFTFINSCVSFLTKLLVSVVWIALTFSTSSSYSFLTTSFFITLPSLLKWIAVVSHFPRSNLKKI